MLLASFDFFFISSSWLQQWSRRRPEPSFWHRRHRPAYRRRNMKCECVCSEDLVGSTNLGRTQVGYPSSPEPTVTTLSCRNLGEITQAEGAASVLEAGLFKGGRGGDFFWACKFEVVVPPFFHTPQWVPILRNQPFLSNLHH